MPEIRPDVPTKQSKPAKREVPERLQEPRTRHGQQGGVGRVKILGKGRNHTPSSSGSRVEGVLSSYNILQIAYRLG